jgi:hypothetical protein
MSRIPYCLDNRLTDGDEVVSYTRWPRSIPKKHKGWADHIARRRDKSVCKSREGDVTLIFVVSFVWQRCRQSGGLHRVEC